MDTSNLTLTDAIVFIISRERQRLGLTQQALANKANRHPVHLSKLERGSMKDMGVNTLAALAAGMTTDPARPVTASSLVLEAEEFLRVAPTLPPPPPGMRAADYWAGVLAGRKILGGASSEKEMRP